VVIGGALVSLVIYCVLVLLGYIKP